MRVCRITTKRPPGIVSESRSSRDGGVIVFQIAKLLTGLLGNRRARGGSGPGPRRGGRPTIAWRPSPSTVRMLVTGMIIATIIIGLFVTASFWVNWWWFGSLGYRSVLVTEYLTRVVAFLLGGLLAAAFFAANWRYALRRAKLVSDQDGARANAVGSSRFVMLPLWALTLGVAVVTGSAAAARWHTWLLWLNGRDFDIVEPIFNHDAGFYVFALPGLTALHQGAIALVLVTMAVVAVLYVVRLGLSSADLRRPPRAVRTHVLALAGGIILLLGAGYLLANYRMLYETHSVFYGPGYTNVNVERWANYLLALLSAGAAALLLLNAWVRRLRLLLIAFVAWAIVGVLLGQVLPAAVQQAVVEPNEQRRERAYVDNNIDLTLQAYDLDSVDQRDLAGQGVPDLSDYSPTSPIFDNIRLWDYRIILDTFQQLRTFVNYYRFQDVDVDRYEIDGRLRQIVISARELFADGLPGTAQTWNNRHLVYTHGYGAVVSPVSEVTPQDLPVFFVDDIPPQGTGVLEIDRPEIYFGEAPSDWVAVNTDLPEVSGISGETEAEAYTGEPRGSIGVGNYFQRLIMAVYLQDRRIVLGNPMNSESRILIRRQIVGSRRSRRPISELRSGSVLGHH